MSLTMGIYEDLRDISSVSNWPSIVITSILVDFNSLPFFQIHYLHYIQFPIKLENGENMKKTQGTTSRIKGNNKK